MRYPRCSICSNGEFGDWSFENYTGLGLLDIDHFDADVLERHALACSGWIHSMPSARIILQMAPQGLRCGYRYDPKVAPISFPCIFQSEVACNCNCVEDHCDSRMGKGSPPQST